MTFQPTSVGFMACGLIVIVSSRRLISVVRHEKLVADVNLVTSPHNPQKTKKILHFAFSRSTVA
jgi:hypothetical protein